MNSEPPRQRFWAPAFGLVALFGLLGPAVGGALAVPLAFAFAAPSNAEVVSNIGWVAAAIGHAFILIPAYVFGLGPAIGAGLVYALADSVARQQVRASAKTAALAAIGVELAKSNSGPAVDYLEEAEGLLVAIEDEDARVPLLQQISHGYGRLGDWNKARKLAEEIPLPPERIFTLCEITGALWNAGQTAAAKESFRDAQESVAQVTNQERAGALSDLAATLAQMGRTSEAVQFWEEAVSLAKYAAEPSKILYSICGIFISLDRRERAREVALLIENDARRRQALSLLAEK